MYEEPSPNREKMMDRARDVLIDYCSNIHPFSLEMILKEIYAEYEGFDLSSRYHKQYYPYLVAFMNGMKKAHQQAITNEKKRLKIKEAVERRKKAKAID